MAPPLPFPILLSLLLLIFPFTSTAQKSPSKTFSYTNAGEFGPYIAEYGATYRILPISTPPFQLCFFNTTPGAFYLALRLGTPRSESTFRFVWTANPSRPVADNAAFSLLADGELRLTDADGTLVFSSGTTGKGVDALRLLSNGNIVLVDSSGRSLWQSFEHPTDTLLVGQSLPVGKKLVSRGPDRKYSLAADPSGLGLYIRTASGSVMYSTGDGKLRLPDRGRVEAVSFGCAPETEEAYAYELTLELHPGIRKLTLARPKYNATLSFLRVEDDGDLVVYTYYDPVDYGAWEKTFVLFSDEKGWESGCRRPAKCGNLGVCDNEMCVACPTATGLGGWNNGCGPAVRRCEGKGFYKVEGVETFLSSFGSALEGGGVDECFNKCRTECSCVGVLHWEKEGKCWIATGMESSANGPPMIGTLEKVEYSGHVMWIKE